MAYTRYTSALVACTTYSMVLALLRVKIANKEKAPDQRVVVLFVDQLTEDRAFHADRRNAQGVA